MKRGVGLVFIIIFLLSFYGLSVAQSAGLEAKKEKLEKARKYLRLLDKKIEQARRNRKINKLAELKDIKRNELQRAKVLRIEVDKLSKSKAGKPQKGFGWGGPKGDFQAGGGYGGGALMVKGGYALPYESFNVLFDAGLGIGNQYSIVTVGGAGVFPLKDYYVGMELELVYYSEKVESVLGLSGSLEKGAKFGVGIFGGMNLGTVDAQVGYNSALGLMVGVVYKF